MIGFHYQGNSDDWPYAVASLPAGAPVKVVDGVQRCVEAKAVNPDCYTVVRHYTSDQNPSGDLHEKARAFFATFIDGSFRQIAHAVDAVQEWNEYLANSQGTAERDRWIAWAQACVDVWREYRNDPDYAHIELIIAEAAIGNDIPLEFAKLSHDNDWVILGYHAYVPVWRGEIRPDDWTYYSGRWEQMDIRYRRIGYTVRWFFGEFGAVGHNGPGWPNSLAANDGWEHPDVYNGDLPSYIDMMAYWMDKTIETQAWKDGRVIGATIFTSGGGSLWRHFELAQPFMGIVAEAVNSYMSNVPEQPDPPDPPVPDCTGLPRTQYARRVLVVPQDATLPEWLSVCQEAFAHRQSVGFSYDDAGIGDLDNRTAILYGLRDNQHAEFRDWYKTHYPGVAVEFRDYAQPEPEPATGIIIDVSHWQGVMDWEQADASGVTHAYIKASDGSQWIDPEFANNWVGAKAVGIQRGAYHYFRNHIPASDQAAFFLEQLGSDIGELPFVLDVEDKNGKPAHSEIKEWLDIVAGPSGALPVIYTAAWYWDQYVGRTDWAQNYPLWVAHYVNEGGQSETLHASEGSCEPLKMGYVPASYIDDAAIEPPLIPNDWNDWWLWQYTSSGDGELYGAKSAAIDLNRVNTI